jgi:hypothetical protein
MTILQQRYLDCRSADRERQQKALIIQAQSMLNKAAWNDRSVYEVLIEETIHGFVERKQAEAKCCPAGNRIDVPLNES